MKRIITIVLLLLTVGCKAETINSQTAATDINIDGKLLEWGVLQNPSNKSIGIGVMNDDTNLYVALSTYDEAIKSKLIHGMTLWINSDGKKKETFGIKYPLQKDMHEMGSSMNEPRPEWMSPDQGRDSDAMFEQLLLQQENLILIDNGFERYLPIDNGENGVQVKMAHVKENMIYELKIPLTLLEISKGKIAIGIKSEEIERPEMKGLHGESRGGGMKGGSPPSGRGGMQDGGSPSRGGGPGGEIPNMDSGYSSQLKMWIKVLLATE